MSSHQWRHISGKPLHTTLSPPAPPNLSTPLRISCDIRKQQLITDSLLLLLLLLFNHFYAKSPDGTPLPDVKSTFNEASTEIWRYLMPELCSLISLSNMDSFATAPTPRVNDTNEPCLSALKQGAASLPAAGLLIFCIIISRFIGM